MSIIQDNITIHKSTLQDYELSDQALGFLVRLLSFPPDWEFNSALLAKKMGVNEATIYRRIQTLIEHGYAERESIRDDKGQFVKHQLQVFGYKNENK